MAKLTDRERKRIVAEYIEIGSYSAVAKIHGVTRTTVARIVSEADPTVKQKIQQKKEQNTQDVLAYMETQKKLVCQIIGEGLSALAEPEKLRSATPSQITTAIGTLIDKWAMLPNQGKTDDRVQVIIDV